MRSDRLRWWLVRCVVIVRRAAGNLVTVLFEWIVDDVTTVGLSNFHDSFVVGHERDELLRNVEIEEEFALDQRLANSARVQQHQLSVSSDLGSDEDDDGRQ